MAFREESIPRTTYRYGQTRSVRGKRANQAFHPTASGDQSWNITLGVTDSAIRILVAPDPTTNVDRDVFAFRLLSTEMVPGAEDRAVYGTGSSTDYLSATVGAGFRPSDASGSISAWINPSDTGVNVILATFTVSTNRMTLYLNNVSGNLNVHIESRLAAGTTNLIRGNTDITRNAWHHVVVTSSGTAWVMYVDGVIQSLTTTSGSNTGDWLGDVDGTTLYLGQNAAGTAFLDAALDEVCVFTTTLTQAQVTTLYALGKGLLFNDVFQSLPGLVHYWSLSLNHTAVGFDRVGGITLTDAGLDDNIGGIPRATIGYDRAVEFFGGTTSSLRATSTNLRPADTSGSISVWFNKAGGTEPIFSKSTGTAANRFEVGTDSSNRATVRHTIASGTTNEIRGNTSIGTDTWGHIVVVSNGTAWAIYVNGVAQTLTTVTGSNTGDWFGDFVGTQFEIGRAVGVATELDGIVDELGVWSTQLTAGNVTSLYSSGSGVLYDTARTIPGLVHYWSFSIQHGGLGADRLGGVALTIDNKLYDEVGITVGATLEPYINQLTLGIRNNEGFVELKDDDGNITWRMDDTGMLFEEGGTIVEATDGEIVITTAGSDPDFRLQSLAVANAMLFDSSVPEFLFFGELSIDNTSGGRIMFASNSYVVEESDGALSVRAVGTDPDIILESNTVTGALLFDQSVPEWLFFGELGIDNTSGGRITFASNSSITEQSDGELTIGAVGTDPDILLTANAGSVVNTIFVDQSAATCMFFNTKVRVDTTGAADGGGFTFEPGSVFRVTATTGLTSFRAVGTNPDLQLGSTTYVNAIYWDFSLTNLALLAGTDTAQTMTIGAAAVTTANRARVDIYQRGATDSLPVLWLNQQDTSEPFIAFEGSSTLSNTTESIVVVNAVTTATIVGYVKVYVEDDGNNLTDAAYYQALYSLA